MWRQAAIGAAFLLASACISEADGAVKALGPGHLYVTWKGLEPDKIASAWLIKRFVDRKAVFRFVTKGTPIKEGIPFDTPFSKLARSHSRSTFESILDAVKAEDQVLREVGLIIRDIEVNAWGKKTTDEAVGVDTIVRGVVRTCPSEMECLEKGFVILDGLYAGLKR